MNYKVIVTTCDKHKWILKLFTELFNKYWCIADVDILTESKLDFTIPENFNVIEVGEWPKHKWSNVVREHLRRIPENNVIIMLDDYLLTRDVDVNGIEILSDYMLANEEILRIDLTSDRLHAFGDSRAVKDVCSVKHYDLISANGSSYEMSLQAGLYNKKLLSYILVDNMDPWRIELESQPIIDYYNMIVLGTRQIPVKYVNALGTGTPEGKVNLRGIDPVIIERAKYYKWIKEGYEIIV